MKFQDWTPLSNLLLLRLYALFGQKLGKWFCREKNIFPICQVGVAAGWGQIESGALPDRSLTWHQPSHRLDSLGHDQYWHEDLHHNNFQFAHLMDLQTAICGAEHCPKHQLRGQPWSCWHTGEFAWLSGRPSCSCYLVNFILSDHWKDGLHFSRSNRFGNNSIFGQLY